MTQSIIANELKYRFPSPSSYQISNNNKLGKNEQKAPKGCYFLDEATWAARQTPSAKYNTDNRWTQKRVSLGLINKYWVQKEKLKIAPEPCTYDAFSSFNKMQKHAPAFRIHMLERKTMFDFPKKPKNKVPAVCFYKLKDEVYNRISKSPLTPRRH